MALVSNIFTDKFCSSTLNWFKLIFIILAVWILNTWTVFLLRSSQWLISGFFKKMRTSIQILMYESKDLICLWNGVASMLGPAHLIIHTDAQIGMACCSFTWSTVRFMIPQHEFVLQLRNVWSLVSCHSNHRIPQLQGHKCHKQVVITTDISISHYPHILKRAPPFAIDDDMINLAVGSSFRWCAGEFFDAPVR